MDLLTWLGALFAILTAAKYATRELRTILRDVYGIAEEHALYRQIKQERLGGRPTHHGRHDQSPAPSTPAP